MDLIKKVACKDLGDLGVKFRYNDNTYLATRPHGVLDPQPHQAEAERMVKGNVFKWVGFDNKDTLVVGRAVDPNLAPTVEEMRKGIAQGVSFVGQPVTANPELSRIIADAPSPAATGALPGETSAGIPNPEEMRARIARAEAHSSTDVRRVIDAKAGDGTTLPAATSVLVEPKGERPPMPMPAFKPEKEASMSDAERVDALQALAANFEQIEKEELGPPRDPLADDAELPLIERSTKELRVMAKELGVKSYNDLTHPMLVKSIAAKKG